MLRPLLEGAAEGAAAAFFVGTTLYSAHAAAARLLPRVGRTVRWSAAALLGCWAAICSFHLLSSVDLFRLPVALGLAALATLLVRLWSGVTIRQVGATLAEDVQSAARYAYGSGSGVSRFGRCALVALIGSIVGRALILPPMGWDTMTYHGVKAGLWVQSGGLLDLAVPGYWADYRHFPPGGEILGAWAMLPFGDDSAYLWVDLAVWLCLAAVLHALAKQFSVSVRSRPLLIAYLLTVPGLYFWIGSGYVDATVHLLLLGGLLFLLRAIDQEQAPVAVGLWLLAWGTAQAVKVTVLPLLAMSPVLALAVVRRNRDQRHGVLLGAVAGGLGLLAAIGPILVDSTRELGFPLSPFPARIAGLTLGEIGEALALMRDTPGWSWGEELRAFFRMFGAGSGASLGPLAAVAVPLGVVASIRTMRQRFLSASVALLFCAAIAAPYLSPSYASMRMMLASQSGRFLYPMLVVLALFAAARMPTVLRTSHQRVLAYFVVAGVVGTVLTNMLVNGSPGEWPMSVAVMLLVAGIPYLADGLRRFRPGGFGTKAVAAMTSLALAGGLAGLLAAAPLRSYRNSLRYELLTASRIAHDPPIYWVPLAAAVDHPEQCERIAIAGGPRRFPNGFYYFFLGSRLQNRLFYVPPTRSGGVPTPWRPGAEWPSQLDSSAWLRRLREAGITYVASLLPRGPEMDWIEANPAEFTLVVGDPAGYGLWRFEPGVASN